MGFHGACRLEDPKDIPEAGRQTIKPNHSSAFYSASVNWHRCLVFTLFYFFKHLAEAFIQSNLHRPSSITSASLPLVTSMLVNLLNH